MSAALVPDRAGAGPRITGFAGNSFRIDGQVHAGGVLLTPERAVPWDAATLDLAAVEPALALDPPPEFVLLGTGAETVRPSRALIDALDARGIGVEAMASRAAARAWGILRAEGRWISALLLPLDR